MQNQAQNKYCKVEAIAAYWDKMLMKWFKIAYKAKDTGMKNILNKIACIDSEVKESVIKSYVV